MLDVSPERAERASSSKLPLERLITDNTLKLDVRPALSSSRWLPDRLRPGVKCSGVGGAEELADPSAVAAVPVGVVMMVGVVVAVMFVRGESRGVC